MIPDLQARITLEPGKRGGMTCIRGMRIAVRDVLGWLASGMSVDEILGDYPELDKADIQACLGFSKSLSKADSGDLKDLGDLVGALNWEGDPVAWQRSQRDEWPDLPLQE